jgi:hypothetical protein
MIFPRSATLPLVCMTLPEKKQRGEVAASATAVTLWQTARPAANPFLHGSQPPFDLERPKAVWSFRRCAICILLKEYNTNGSNPHDAKQHRDLTERRPDFAQLMNLSIVRNSRTRTRPGPDQDQTRTRPDQDQTRTRTKNQTSSLLQRWHFFEFSNLNLTVGGSTSLQVQVMAWPLDGHGNGHLSRKQPSTELKNWCATLSANVFVSHMK